MADRTGEPVKLPNSHNIKAALVGIGHQPVQFGPSVFRPADSRINVLPGDSPAAPLAALAQLAQLHLRGLPIVRCADSRVQRRAGYAVGSHVAPPMCNWVRGALLLVTAARPAFLCFL